MKIEPAMSVAVYRNPGPDDLEIAGHARGVLESHSYSGTGGGLGYVTLVESDFDRLMDGLVRGDALGTAFAILRFLGPKAEQFIDHYHDFTFGWTEQPDARFGTILFLQIFPRRRLSGRMN